MPVISPQGPKSECCFTNVNGPCATLAEHLVLSFKSATGDMYNISVCPGEMYKITYYDSYIQSMRTITGRVTGISQDTIAVEVITVMDQAGNVCLCDNRDKLAGYLSAQYFYVPVNNITSIANISISDKPINPCERGETIVSILGISSTVIRAVIVRLNIFDDNISHTVTPVDMMVGGLYHIVYAKNNSTYELDGKLIRIDEIGLCGDETTECGYVRPDCNTEVVGAHGNTYDPNYFYSLPKYNQDGNRIRFVFDTSKDFHQRFDTVMLTDIRNVVRVDGGCPPHYPIPPYPPCPPHHPHPPCNPWPGPCDPTYPCGPNDWPNPLNDLSSTGSDAPSLLNTENTGDHLNGDGNMYYNQTGGESIQYTSLNNQEDILNEVPADFNKL